MRCFIDGPAGYPFDIGPFLQYGFALSAANYAKLSSA